MKKVQDIVREAHRFVAVVLRSGALDWNPPEEWDVDSKMRWREAILEIAEKIEKRARVRTQPKKPPRPCAACGRKLYSGRRSCQCGCWNGPSTY